MNNFITKKNFLIFAGIFCLVLLMGLGLYFGYNKYFKKYPVLVDQRSSNIEQKNREEITAADMAEVRGKSDQQIEDDFEKDNADCVSQLNGLESKTMDEIKGVMPEMLKIGFFDAENFITCTAVKENKTDYCDLLSDSSRQDVCKKLTSLFVNTMFPSLKTDTCSADAINACKEAGQSGCEDMCTGLVLSKSKEDCEKLQGNSQAKTVCLAINQDDLSICDSLSGIEAKDECQVFYYFIKAVRNNDPSFLDYIVNRGSYGVFELYFDPQYDCRALLKKFGDNNCPSFYRVKRLQLLKSARDSQQ
jgi:hypothetical protein